jgi:hypothetical protein
MYIYVYTYYICIYILYMTYIKHIYIYKYIYTCTPISDIRRFTESAYRGTGREVIYIYMYIYVYKYYICIYMLYMTYIKHIYIYIYINIYIYTPISDIRGFTESAYRGTWREVGWTEGSILRCRIGAYKYVYMLYMYVCL